MVPEGWKLTSLGEVCDGNLKTGPFGSQLHAHEYVEDGVPVIMPKDLIGCRVNIETAAKITKERANDLKKHILEVGDLIFSRRGDVARFALIDEVSSQSLCGTGCLRARPSNKHSSVFLSYFLQKSSVKKWLEQNAVGQTMPNMNTAILFELPLASASSKAEEEKIAKILSTWDRAIEVMEKLIANSQQQKKSLMQQLLSGKKRLPGFSDEWLHVRVGSLLSVRKEKKIPSEDAPLFSLTIEKGITKKTERYNREFLVKNSAEKKYKCVKPNDIVFNPANLRWGAINYSRLKHDVVVSPIYEVLYITNDKSNNLHYVAQALMSNNQIAKFASMVEGTLMERKAVKIEPFLATKILVPPTLGEQQKIASVLSIADKEIETLQQKIECLRQEKKALMQQLLTGKRRVKVGEEAV